MPTITEASEEKQKTANFLFSKTYGLGGADTVGTQGNHHVSKRGQLESMLVSAIDKKYFQKELKKNNILAIDAPDTFNTQIDGFIRSMYGTPELESLVSAGHKVFDAYMNRRLDMAGVQRGNDFQFENSATSPSLNMHLGFGDCRHHAMAKLILYSLWKEHRLNVLMEQISHTTDAEEKKNLYNKAKKISHTHMVIMDVEIKSNVASDKKYSIAKTDDGHCIASDKEKSLEDHTLTAIIETDDEGGLVNFFASDAFYHDEYKLNYTGKSIADKIQIYKDANGKEHYRIEAGTISAVDAAGNILDVPFFLEDVVYAQETEKRLNYKTEITNPENTYFAGIPVDKGILEQESSEVMAKMMDTILGTSTEKDEKRVKLSGGESGGKKQTYILTGNRYKNAKKAA